jgi:hypothetical protein
VEAADEGTHAAFGWDAWLPFLDPHLPPLLIDRRAREWLDGVTRLVPGDCAGVLELRLAGDSPAVDFAFRLVGPDQARSVAPRLSSARARSFVSRWARREPGLEPVSCLWLELDAALGAGAGREPGSLAPPLLCARLDRAVDAGWLTGSLLPALCGEALPAARRRILDRCLDALPSSARVLYVFSLLGRPGEAVRIELFGLEPAAMAAYLRRAAVPRAAGLVEAAAPLVAGADRFHLSFDVGAEVAPRIGVECGFERQPRREPRWTELLDRLVVRRLADPAKRDAVLAWPGQDSLWSAPGRWPAAALGLGGHTARGLSHLKLVLRPGRAPEAKAYLLFQHLPAGVDAGHGVAATGAGSPSSPASPATCSR